MNNVLKKIRILSSSGLTRGSRLLSWIFAFTGMTVFLLLFISGCSREEVIEGKSVCFDSKKCFEIELAVTAAQRQKGLQNRDDLTERQGMLFIFQTSDYHSFWMKETLMALDILWLDEQRRVVHIEKNVPPCQKDPCPVYSPEKKASYVFEIPAGVSQKRQIQIGDQAEFKLR